MSSVLLADVLLAEIRNSNLDFISKQHSAHCYMGMIVSSLTCLTP